MATERSRKARRTAKKVQSRIVKVLLIAGGSLSLMLAVLGIIVPFLPATPFLLLSAACFARSSDRLYQWLIGHRVFGRYIRTWRKHRAMPLHAKLVLLALLWVSIGATAVFATSHIAVRIVVIMIAVGVTVFVLKVRTMPADAE